MKWFKHMADASDDEFIALLEEELGLEGIARWWKLLEAIAKQMDKSDRCSASYPIQKWMLILSAKQKRVVELFVKVLQNFDKIQTKRSGNILEIICPKLLEFRDEYSRKSGQTPDTTPDKVAPEAEAEKESKINPLTPLAVDNSLPIPIPIPSNSDPKKEGLNEKSFDAAAAACCILLGRRVLTPTDSALLMAWIERISFEQKLWPLIVEKTQKFADKNLGKRPASLQYFTEAVRELK